MRIGGCATMRLVEVPGRPAHAMQSMAVIGAVPRLAPGPQGHGPQRLASGARGVVSSGADPHAPRRLRRFVPCGEASPQEAPEASDVGFVVGPQPSCLRRRAQAPAARHRPPLDTGVCAHRLEGGSMERFFRIVPHQQNGLRRAFGLARCLVLLRNLAAPPKQRGEPIFQKSTLI